MRGMPGNVRPYPALTGTNTEGYRIAMTTNLLQKGWYFTSLT